MRHITICGAVLVLALGGCGNEVPATASVETGTPAVVLDRGQDQYAAMQQYLAPYRAELMKNGYHPDRLARYLAHSPRGEWDYRRKVYTGEIRGVSFWAPEGSLLHEYWSAIRLTEAEGGPSADRQWPPKRKP